MKTLSAEKKIANKLIEECTETVEEVKLAQIALSEDKNERKCMLYIVLFSIVLTIDIEIVSCFVYTYWQLKEEYVPLPELGTRTQTTVY